MRISLLFLLVRYVFAQVVFNGLHNNDYLGYNLANLGDVNGDNLGDVLLGAIGSAYLLFGSSSPWNRTFQLDELDGQNGVIIGGLPVDQKNGWSMNGAGDFNADGIKDFVIGVRSASADADRPASGVVYLIFGRHSWPNVLELDQPSSLGGLVINGVGTGDYFGAAVAGVGDVNNDGRDDLLIGAPKASPDADRPNAGQAYLIYGTTELWPSPVEILELDDSAYVIFNGKMQGEGLGTSVDGVRDMNEDNYSDLILGSPNLSQDGLISNGGAYVVFGHGNISHIFDLSTIDGVNGFQIIGSQTDAQIALRVAGGGDINADGVPDIGITAPNAASNPGQQSSGVVYIIFGRKNTTWPTPIPVVTLNGVNGFAATGAKTQDHAGTSLSISQDIDNDGFGDLLIGAPNANVYGTLYVVFGRSTWNVSFSLDEVNDTVPGYVLFGSAPESTYGTSLMASYNLSGNGVPHVFVGAPHTSTSPFTSNGQIVCVTCTARPDDDDNSDSDPIGQYIGIAVASTVIGTCITVFACHCKRKRDVQRTLEESVDEEYRNLTEADDPEEAEK